MKKLNFTLIFCLLLFIPSISIALVEDAYQIYLKSFTLDEGDNYKKEIKLELINKTGKKRVRDICMWKIENGDEDKSMILFRGPASVKGTAFLTWQQKLVDDNQWLYLPALKRVRRISGNEKNKSFMGTDFSYNDLSQPHPENFTHRLLGEELVDGNKCYKIESIHKSYLDNQNNREIEKYQYSKSITWIRKDNYVAIKADLYDQDGNKLKEYYTQDTKKINDIWTTHILIMKNIQTQHETILNIKKIEYNIGLTDSFFTQRQLTNLH